VHQAFKDSPPPCVAVMPLEAAARDDKILPSEVDAVRRAVYAHLAPQGRRVEKPARVDFVLGKLDPAQRGDLALIGKRLDCGALIEGKVTEWSSHFFGIYSRVAVGAELKMVRAADGKVLWEGKHVAAMQGGTIPLSPIGIAMGAFDAASNVEEEQTFRVVDDLARRLVNTIPDNSIVALDDPAAPATPIAAVPLKPAPEPNYKAFLASLADLAPPEQRTLLVAAVDHRSFGQAGQGALLDALVATPPPRAADEIRYADYLAESGDYAGALGHADAATVLDPASAPAQFARGRMLIALGRLDQAEPPILKAVARDGSNATYLNALGYVSGLDGRPERALIAYRMAFDADHADGYALYNTGVLLYNRGDQAGAADAFYGAGLAYLKAKNYGQAGKALANLKELAAKAPVPPPHIDTLESALAALAKKGDQS